MEHSPRGGQSVPGGRNERIAPEDLSQVVTLLDHLPGMVAYWDEQLRNRVANAAYLEWFGVAPEAMRGMHIRDLLGRDVYEKNLPYIKAALAGEPQLFNRTLIDAFGRTRHTQASYIPRMTGGQPRGFFVLVTDITERVEAEEALATSVAEFALLRERQRVAADMHDIVIQTLYSAGLSLSQLSRDLDPQQAERANDVIDRIDEAIRSLRAAIRGITRSITAPQLVADLAHLVDNAAADLGFVPRLVTEGPSDLIPHEARAEILAVTQEALANIAKHAGADRVTVTLTAGGAEVRLVIADNGIGIGIPQTERRSGLANLRSRAKRLGGDLTVLGNEPHGTMLDWHVPSTLALRRSATEGTPWSRAALRSTKDSSH